MKRDREGVDHDKPHNGSRIGSTISNPNPECDRIGAFDVGCDP
jgi:hypothetical protein